MSRQEQINKLMQYREYLLILKQEQEDKMIKTGEKQKVLVLKKKFNGKELNVA